MISSSQSESIGNDKVNIDRVESKYVLDKKYLAEVIAEVTQHLKPYYPIDETAFTLVKSVYFDSDDFIFVKQHLAGQEDRRKLRIRSYGPDGVWEPTTRYFEDKYKSDGKSMKARIQINDRIEDEMLRTNRLPLDPELISLNSDLSPKDFEEKVKLLNYLMLIYKVKPAVEITYKRYAYQDESSPLRVTIDQDIKAMPLRIPTKSEIHSVETDLQGWEKLKDIGTKYYPRENFVLEVKSDGNPPDWVKKLLKDVDAEETAFSKYLWGIYNIFIQILNLGSRG
jgi:SPX domain protein involved in polyphosphate accumulation